MTGHLNPRSSEAISKEALIARVAASLDARAELFDSDHAGAFRLFNGFYEGYPDLVVDIYARTLLVYNYARPPGTIQELLIAVKEFLFSELRWVRAFIQKNRSSNIEEERRGIRIGTEEPDRYISENGVKYAIDLLMNQDSSLYLDTRNLRAWLKQNLAQKTLLNTFAYTGSYGIAARAGGARRVVLLDLNRKFLTIARKSYALNGFSIKREGFLCGDFWTTVNELKRRDDLFDCVIVDPPIFSRTKKGTIDLIHHGQRVINKVRPLINDQGYLIAINNGLFVSGSEYIQMLETLCADGYLKIETLIPVPPDFTGYSQVMANALPTDPTPFNHPTKIAILRVRRKL